jgi:hypothetical protein
MSLLRKYASILIPLTVFLLASLFAWWIAGAGNCWSGGFHPDCWVRWDSALYMQIAEQGHTLFYCGPEQGYPEGAKDWCGNSGWAVLYPFLMFLVSKISGWSLAVSGIALSKLFFLGYLIVVARLLEIKDLNPRNWILIGIAAFCPGSIYFHAVFPISLVAFCISLLILFLKQEKYAAAGITGFFAVLAYSTGFFLLLVLALFGLVLWRQKHPKLMRYLIYTCGLSGLALIGLFSYDYWATGHWDALFKIQGKYGHGMQSPFKMFAGHWELLMKRPFTLLHWSEIQNMVMIIYISVLIWTAYRKYSRPFHLFFSLFLLIFWFLPYSISLQVSLYRNAAVLGAGHTVADKLPTWALVLVLLSFLGLSYPLGILFIQSTII